MDRASYTLGLFDAEGWVTANRYERRSGAIQRNLVAGIKIAGEDAIQMCVSEWGGSAYRRKGLSVGRLILWEWHLSCGAALPFLRYVTERGLVKAGIARVAEPLAALMSGVEHPNRRRGRNLKGGEAIVGTMEADERDRLIIAIQAANHDPGRYLGMTEPCLADPLAYGMGLFDGEGCISASIIKRPKGGAPMTALQVSVTMASESACRLLHNLWGGAVHSRPRPTINGLILWNWRVTGGSALPFLSYAVENSLVKRAQAEVAIQIASLMNTNKGARWGVARNLGETVLSADQMIERHTLAAQLRSLNGARSRFDPAFIPT